MCKSKMYYYYYYTEKAFPFTRNCVNKPSCQLLINQSGESDLSGSVVYLMSPYMSVLVYLGRSWKTCWFGLFYSLISI